MSFLRQFGLTGIRRWYGQTCGCLLKRIYCGGTHNHWTDPKSVTSVEGIQVKGLGNASHPLRAKLMLAQNVEEGTAIDISHVEIKLSMPQSNDKLIQLDFFTKPVTVKDVK